MGKKRRKGRPVDGVLLLDKEPGCSSNQALQRVKRLFKADKAGHTGSLDPLASGLLPVCFGEATKVSGFLLDADKGYWVRAALGAKTSTGDAEGETIAASDAPPPDAERVRETFEAFTGEQMQVPPMHSAVKHQGRRLYELAREGQEVERKPRVIRVREMRLLSLDNGVMELEVTCSKGTYVRTLVEDIAERLGTYAHVTALRRTRVGPFEGKGMLDMVRLESLAEQGWEALDATLLPIASALGEWPAVSIDPDSSFYLSRGQPVQVPQAPTMGWVRVYDDRERLLAVGEVLDDGRIAPRRMLQRRWE